jgi:hypothetical protein
MVIKFVPVKLKAAAWETLAALGPLTTGATSVATSKLVATVSVMLDTLPDPFSCP